jgi:hypothetical protein
MNSTRLASPVSESWSAWCASCRSASRRPVTLRATQKTPSMWMPSGQYGPISSDQTRPVVDGN